MRKVTRSHEDAVIVVTPEAIEESRTPDSRYQLIDRLYRAGMNRIIFSRTGIRSEKQKKAVC